MNLWCNFLPIQGRADAKSVINPTLCDITIGSFPEASVSRFQQADKNSMFVFLTHCLPKKILGSKMLLLYHLLSFQLPHLHQMNQLVSPNSTSNINHERKSCRRRNMRRKKIKFKPAGAVALFIGASQTVFCRRRLRVDSDNLTN